MRDSWHADDNNWKLGVFYFNKADKRLLVPKKIPVLGWTLNFANPLCFIPLLIIIGIYFFARTYR